MKPSKHAKRAAAVTLARGKMFEFGVPEELHVTVPADVDLNRQFPLAIGTIGDFAAEKLASYLISSTTATPIHEVLFATQVLLAVADAQMASTIAPLVRLVAASALFLADSPGRAVALSKALAFEESVEYSMADCLLTVLHRPWRRSLLQGYAPQPARALLFVLWRHYAGQAIGDELRAAVSALKRWSYDYGSARDLLLADLIGAVAVQRVKHSARTCLPLYTGQDAEVWDGYLARPNAIRDLWPAQRVLGEANIFRGASAVVQMPTSTGKTRATEMVIRAAFVSGRTGIAVVVAPYRALCYEIAHDLKLKFEKDGYQINQLSDAIQQDYVVELDDFLRLGIDTAPHVIVVTPEKLLYILRHEQSLMDGVGLMVYDEGHQFDSSTRGVTYELLLTSIKNALPATAQTVLISAVVNNSAQLAGWLLADKSKVVTDQNSQTARHVAFTTFEAGASGQLRFESTIAGEEPFLVPRLVQHHRLSGDSEDAEEFPSSDGSSIALYLALNLAAQGGVAIFVKAPDSASKIIREAANDILPRAPHLPRPVSFSNETEVDALSRLYEDNFGAESFLTKGAALGLYAHTGDTPEGIRLAIEHAMRESLVHFVVCTSTLAQGVNLPIKYLLVTHLSQGGRQLQTRDFQNLIGRAGRAGMYADGTVIFTNPKLFDDRVGKRRSWLSARALLDPKNAAPTSSALLNLTKPLTDRFETSAFPLLSALDVIEALIEQPDALFGRIDALVAQLDSRSFTADDLKRQVSERLLSVRAVECFLMAQLAEEGIDGATLGVVSLVESTFAHYLATAKEQELLLHAFRGIWSRISRHSLPPETQARYGRSLLGLGMGLEIDAFVRSTLFELQLAESPKDVLDIVWAFISNTEAGRKLQKLQPASSQRLLVDEWVAGKPFKDILDSLAKVEARYLWGKQKRKLTFDQLVDLCQDELGYRTCLMLASIASSFEAQTMPSVSQSKTMGLFGHLLKMLKYGLATWEQISVYELGFAERIIATKLASELPSGTVGVSDTKRELLRRARRVESLLNLYPQYFQVIFKSLGG